MDPDLGARYGEPSHCLRTVEAMKERHPWKEGAKKAPSTRKWRARGALFLAKIPAELDTLGHRLVVVPRSPDVGPDRVVAGRVILAHAPVQAIDEAALAGDADRLQTTGCGRQVADLEVDCIILLKT